VRIPRAVRLAVVRERAAAGPPPEIDVSFEVAGALRLDGLSGAVVQTDKHAMCCGNTRTRGV
jgi:hypothetical protein